MSSIYDRASAAADFLRSRTQLRPTVGLVLGSGLGAFADELDDAVKIPYDDIPGFPKCSAEGHAGKLVIGKVGETVVAAMQGRVHFYEGLSLEEVTFPMRVFARLGVTSALLTNAAGGINFDYKLGALVVLKDHINFQGTNPLIGPNDSRFGLRFIDMGRAYEPAYREIALREGKRIGIEMHEGVYIAVSGPSYETPAEIKAFRSLGADVVGMSTVPEVIVARHSGIKVLAISCVTNAAATDAAVISHEEVLEIGRKMRGKFVELLRAVIPQMV